MRKNFLASLLVLTISFKPIYSDITEPSYNRLTSMAQTVSEKKPVSPADQTVSFKFDNEPLVNIINSLAEKSCVNVLLPQGANTIKNTVSTQPEPDNEQISLEQAWKRLDTLLDLAGYVRIEHPDMYVIKKSNDEIAREPAPLFIGTPPEKLPDTEQHIRYLYYLSTINVTETDNDLVRILSTLMPKNSYKVEQTTNGIIFSAKASLIKAVMHIIVELDKASFSEKLLIVNLRYASADVVARLFNENILKGSTGYNRYRLDAKRQAEASYFSKNVRIISAQKYLGLNALIVMGKNQAVDRVKKFIDTYIDIELESGKSVLHIYELQYIDADKMRDVLQKVVDSAQSSGTGQAKSAPTAQGGTQRTFGEIIIQSDKSTDEKAQYFGSNKLLIAARNDDWQVLKTLIEKLDQPRPQVLMEVIIADLTFNDLKQLGTSLRNPEKIPMPAGVNFQSAQTPNNQGIILDPSNASPQTLKSDLLNVTLPSDNPTASQATQSVIQGSTVFSLNDNDGRTWGFTQILKRLNRTKILSAPHVIAINGQKALVKLGDEKLLPDESIGTSGSTTIKTKWVQATLEVELTPRISSEADTVNMQVNISVVQYEGQSSSNRTSRKIVTNTNVKNKDVLAIGGLIRTDTSDSIKKTPILGDVPILGYFFKGRSKQIDKTNLTVFISPIIIEPHLRRGMSPETQTSVRLMKAFAQEGQLFDYLKEPITRLFFNTELDNTEEIIDDFTQELETPTHLSQNTVKKRHGKKRKKTLLVQADNQSKKNKSEAIKKLAQNETNPLLRTKRR